MEIHSTEDFSGESVSGVRLSADDTGFSLDFDVDSEMDGAVVTMSREELEGLSRIVDEALGRAGRTDKTIQFTFSKG
jgi:hypothetical protein